MFVVTNTYRFTLRIFNVDNSNSGHMIKFQLFDSERSRQCHYAEISTFVVSISHFMRAFFNYQALAYGQDFRLPEDAAYLNVSAIKQL
jgi:hypothetical protein